MTEQEIPLDAVDVGTRLRAFRPDHVDELAASIEDSGLLHPITVAPLPDGRYRLVAGLHRLEAVRRLGWTTISATVRDLTGEDATLAEIDENLARRALSIMERAEHIARKHEILTARGERQGPGRPRKSTRDETVSVTTADLAKAAGVSRATALRGLEFVHKIAPEARDLLRPTAFANSAYDLRTLAGVTKPADQVEIARLLSGGKLSSAGAAQRAIQFRYLACATCGEVIDSYVWSHKRPLHCAHCDSHYLRSENGVAVCNRCGTSSDHPVTVTPSVPAGLTANAGDDIVGVLPAPFFEKNGYRPDGRITLPDPEGEDVSTVPASETAAAFADAVDALVKLDASALASEATDSPVVRWSLRMLMKWLGPFQVPHDTEHIVAGSPVLDVPSPRQFRRLARSHQEAITSS